MFRRRRAADTERDAADHVEGGGTGVADLADPGLAGFEGAAPANSGPVAPVAPQGPWDAEELPTEYGDDVINRVDLGGLRVPVQDAEVRVDLGPNGDVVAATLVTGASAMQLSAFAAPRSEGIWPEVRAEIASALRTGGGAAEEAAGPFGTELRARIVTPISATAATTQPARFVGVDAPRWFLRALITGPAATDPVQAGPLEDALRRVVVVRGWEAMGVKAQIPLRLPREVIEAAAAGQGGTGEDGAGEDAPTGDGVGDPFERGPEITEVR